MEFTPVNNHILVRNNKDSETLVVSKEAKGKVNEGKVVMEGQISFNDYTCIKNGDKILFSTLSNIEVNIDGEDLLIIKKDDIIGISQRGPEK